MEKMKRITPFFKGFFSTRIYANREWVRDEPSYWNVVKGALVFRLIPTSVVDYLINRKLKQRGLI